MIYYILISVAALLFSMQFLCQQSYQENCGTELGASLSFSIYKGISIVIMMFLLNCFKLEFEWFSFWISGVYALCYILMIYFSLKAFSVANLSVYSVFTMLGGMIIPFIVGVTLFKEEVSLYKAICCLLVIIAVIMNVQKGKGSKKALIYYLLVFTLNGTISAISAIHQNIGLANTDSKSFMFYSGIWTVVICLLWLKLKGEKVLLLRGKNLLYSAGDGFLNGIGDLFLLISVAPGALDASVQYPFVTGGVMVCSTIVSTLRHEKIRTIEYIATAVAFVASVMMAF